MAKTVKKRDYPNDYASVTQALGVLRKIGLEIWYKNNTAEFCDSASKKGKIVGSLIHEVIENYILHQQITITTYYSEDVNNALRSFILFRTEHPEFDLELTEVPMTSEIWKCNGTMDAPLKRNGMLIVGDWKTGECKVGTPKEKDKPPIYDEYKAQVAAYAKFYNEIYKTDINSAIIVAFAKDKIAYNLYEMGQPELDDYFNGMFVPALTILNHQKKYKEINK